MKLKRKDIDRIKTATLKEKRPFLTLGKEPIWFEEGEIFKVLDEREMRCMGLGYKLKSVKWIMELDGYHNAQDFDTHISEVE